jgi:hypothetical protein
MTTPRLTQDDEPIRRVPRKSDIADNRCPFCGKTPRQTGRRRGDCDVCNPDTDRPGDKSASVVTTPRPTAARETPLERRYREAQEASESVWQWMDCKPWQEDRNAQLTLLVRTETHFKADEALKAGLIAEDEVPAPCRVTEMTCSCRAKGLCRHIIGLRLTLLPLYKKQLMEAGIVSAPAPASCQRCLSTGRIGPRHFCSCPVGQALVQNSGQRRRVKVA